MEQVEPVERRLNRFGGWTLIFMGVVHLLLAGLGSARFFGDILDAGFFNTIPVIPPAELLQRTGSFWALFGSFAPVTIVLGYFILWATKRNHALPSLLGPALLVFGLFDVAMAPKGGFYLFLIAGAALTAAALRRRHGRG